MRGQNFPVLCPGVLDPILGITFEEGQSDPGAGIEKMSIIIRGLENVSYK